MKNETRLGHRLVAVGDRGRGARLLPHLPRRAHLDQGRDRARRLEIGVFGALAIWMLISNFEPAEPPGVQPGERGAPATSDFSGVFKGMVFGILAFIGFEAAAPLGGGGAQPTLDDPARGDRLRARRRTLLRPLLVRVGVRRRVRQLPEARRRRTRIPGAISARRLWHAGWVLVFFAIINSAIANANAGVNAASRVTYAMARNGALPKELARTHPEHKTPHIAIIAERRRRRDHRAPPGLEVGPAGRVLDHRDRDHRAS